MVAENWSGRLDVRSELDGKVVNGGVPRYRDLANRHLRLVEQGAVDDESIAWWWRPRDRTRTHRGRRADQGTGERRAGEAGIRLLEEEGRIGHELSLDLARGHAATVEKVVTMFTSRDHAASDTGDEAGTWVVRADGFGPLLERHRLAWDRLWERFELTISGSERTQLLLRLHVFHLLQSLSTHTIDLDVGVSARGLHGEAYRGHVFGMSCSSSRCSTTVCPILTRSLLEYRHRRLACGSVGSTRTGLSGSAVPVAEWERRSGGNAAIPPEPPVRALAARSLASPAARQPGDRVQRLAVLPGHR